MIPYKNYIKEKFKVKKIIEKILVELQYEDYTLNINSDWNHKPAVHIQWLKDKTLKQIFEFRDIFEDRWGDIYCLETKKSDINNIEFYIIERN